LLDRFCLNLNYNPRRKISSSSSPSLRLSGFLSLSVSFSGSLSVCLCLSICLSFSVCLSVCLPPSLSPCLSVCHSLPSPSLSLSLSVAVSLCRCLSSPYAERIKQYNTIRYIYTIQGPFSCQTSSMLQTYPARARHGDDH